MGATTFTRRGYGQSANDAFNELYKEAEAEYGYDSYNGEINNTSLTRDLTSQYKQARNKKAFIEKMLNEVPKRDTWVIELKPPKGNTNKVKSKVNTNPQKGARKWETRFEIWEHDNCVDSSATSQIEAIKKARVFTEKNQKRYTIYITKILCSGNSKVADVEYKQSTTEKPGEYLFIVCAPE